MYSETGETNIGLNLLSCTDAIWYAGPDLAASRLAQKTSPQVVEAFRVVPKGVQAGMKKTAIGTRTINPVTDDFFRITDDFFRIVIEERKNLPKSHPHYLLLKIIANALYGIFAELNKDEFARITPSNSPCFLVSTSSIRQPSLSNAQANGNSLPQLR
jgi:hypothetical protein